ncbi:Sectered polysaccharide deacetylase [Deinococcus sp. KSM4-11]|uniref:YkoP family protein n=1 Tax=Deinococcus sp. KSM4-11 TaxID=2568654 RepID=UPI0010A569E6|nr:Sectered polysaccharide deacetylase [Deinococcus sp. KSM4-11]THF86235.1 Sectered polysaccharide deacetylase [Deinococcus sp. KSM4-11]
MAAPLFPARRVHRALLRAGAYGAWQGGTGGPEIGLTLPVDDLPTLERVLATLGSTRATLIIPAAQAAAWTDALHRATRAGHEVAGAGPPTPLGALDIAVGQPVQSWDATTLNLSHRDLRTLRDRGVNPLPVPGEQAQPGRTLRIQPEDLTTTLADLKARGYRPLPVRDLPGLRRATLRDLLVYTYGQTVEANFTQAHHVIDLTSRPDAVMRVAPLPDAPAPLPLPRNTPTAELHLDSARLVSLATRSQLGTYRAYQRSLKDVGVALRERPELAAAQAVFAVTLFYGPLEQAGFTLLDLPPARARLYGLGFRVLRLVHGTVRPPSVKAPKMAWMPREEFVRRFG